MFGINNSSDSNNPGTTGPVPDLPSTTEPPVMPSVSTPADDDVHDPLAINMDAPAPAATNNTPSPKVDHFSPAEPPHVDAESGRSLPR